MKRYYMVVEDVIYYLGAYRTINEARRRAEIEARRMKNNKSDFITISVITAKELREIEKEEGEQDIIDIDELHKAQNVLIKICNQFENCDCERCPLSVDGECGVGFPYVWDANSNDVICNIGDTIYQIPGSAAYESHILNNVPEQNRVYEMQVTSVEREGNRYKLKYLDYYSSCYSTLYGKTWFLTRKEAEAALAELKQEYGK